MNWIEQADKSGCGVAVLAMLLDTTYARIRDGFPRFCNNCGIDFEIIDQYLAEHGYAVQRIWHDLEFSGEQHKKWPPAPWTGKHYCLVTQKPRDVDGHYVVLGKDGYVLDPADARPRRRRLSGYHKVSWVAGVHHV